MAGLTRRFGPVTALDGLDLAVERGEYFCILGPSGSGKSTLLRILAGFDEPTSGEVFLGGHPVRGVPPERRDVNTVFQGYALFPHMSVADNVAFGLRMKRRPAADIHRRVERMLELVGLAGHRDRRPRELSGGEQQRVALARAIVNEPSVLLLDEPLGALDRALRERMQRELEAIQRQVGITFVHVTHDQAEALRLAHRMAVMRGGRILQVGSPDQVYQGPASAFVANFLGGANLLEGEALPGDTPALAVAPGVALRVRSDPPRPPAGARVRVAVRPEAIRLRAGQGPPQAHGPQGATVLRGRVVARTPLGPLVEYRVAVGPLCLDVHVLAGGRETRARPGDPVALEVDPADVIPLPGEGEGE